MKQRVLSNKQIRIDIRRRLYHAIVVNIAFWRCESWTLKEADRSKLETLQQSCLRRMCRWTMWDVAEKRNTNEMARRTVANSPTMDLMIKMRRCRWLYKLGAVKISKKANTRRMVFNATTSRETSADHTPRIHRYPQDTWF
jgi:hypothetical protein